MDFRTKSRYEFYFSLLSLLSIKELTKNEICDSLEINNEVLDEVINSFLVQNLITEIETDEGLKYKPTKKGIDLIDYYRGSFESIIRDDIRREIQREFMKSINKEIIAKEQRIENIINSKLTNYLISASIGFILINVSISIFMGFSSFSTVGAPYLGNWFVFVIIGVISLSGIVFVALIQRKMVENKND